MHKNDPEIQFLSMFYKPTFAIQRARRNHINIAKTNSYAALECHSALIPNRPHFRLLTRQAHDLRGTADLVEGLNCGQLLADRAFGANWLRTCGPKPR